MLATLLCGGFAGLILVASAFELAGSSTEALVGFLVVYGASLYAVILHAVVTSRWTTDEPPRTTATPPTARRSSIGLYEDLEAGPPTIQYDVVHMVGQRV